MEKWTGRKKLLLLQKRDIVSGNGVNFFLLFLFWICSSLISRRNGKQLKVEFTQSALSGVKFTSPCVLFANLPIPLTDRFAHVNGKQPLCLWLGHFLQLDIDVGDILCQQTEKVITWLHRDTNFIFECWKYLSRVSEANEWEILSAREDKIRISKRPCNVLFIL